MPSTIAARIREARRIARLDQADLAARIDVATRTVQRWEKGDQVPDSNYLMRIARAVAAQPRWLLTGDGDRVQAPGEMTRVVPISTGRYRKVDLVTVPLLASVPGGAPNLIFHSEQVDRYVTVDNIRDAGAFALEVRGNSMSPRIENGDIIVVSPRQEARSGDICVVRVQDEDTVKKIRVEEQFVHLIPLNPEFEPMMVKKRDVTFMWRVVKVIKNL